MLPIAIILFFAAQVEAIVEYFIAPFFAKDVDFHALSLRWISAVVGIVVAFFAGLNMYAVLGITLQFPIFGIIMTGIVISRGANYVNDVITWFRTKAA